jgi:hypothetical protein
VAELVVGGALLIVLEDLVGLVDLLEPPLGLTIAGIAVRVVLHGQLAVSRLELLGRGVPADPKHLVVVSLRHGALVL